MNDISLSRAIRLTLDLRLSLASFNLKFFIGKSLVIKLWTRLAYKIQHPAKLNQLSNDQVRGRLKLGKLLYFRDISLLWKYMIETNWNETNNRYVLSKIITSILSLKKKNLHNFFQNKKNQIYKIWWDKDFKIRRRNWRDQNYSNLLKV